VSQAGYISGAKIADIVPLPKTALLADKTEKLDYKQRKFGRIATSVFVP
jgi:hypothetical protein